MGDIIDQLLARHDVSVSEPAPRTVVDALGERYRAGLPDPFVTLWIASDGIALDSLNAHILGPTEVMLLIDKQAWPPGLVDRGFLPVLDDHQSNFLAVILREPLAFRVAYLPHDDAGRLLYRDVDSFLRSLFEAMQRDESADEFFYGTEGDYPPDAPRTPADQSAAQVLMATQGTRKAGNDAVQLLDASNLAEWATLLETDHFVRRDVVARMEKMTAPTIRALLQRDRTAFEEFANTAAEAARAAGLEVGRREGNALQVGGKWMNLEVFFHRRNVTDAISRTIAWFEDLIAGRDPRKRPGHLLAD